MIAVRARIRPYPAGSRAETLIKQLVGPWP